MTSVKKQRATITAKVSKAAFAIGDNPQLNFAPTI
jgi:hypothetical protein